VLFIVSDFVDTPLDRSLKEAAARHDVILLEVSDPRDEHLPPSGPLVLRDAETGRLAVVDGRRAAAEHRQNRSRQRRDLLALAGKLGVDHLEIGTARPYLSALVRFFEQRRRRLRR
jgi:hypothetical protein